MSTVDPGMLLLGVSATRVQLIPEVIDFTVIPDAAGTTGLMFAAYGAVRGFGPDRLGRITLFGNLVGAVAATGGLGPGSSSMHSRDAMVRALAPCVAGTLSISAAGGAAYGAGLIGVLAVYAVMLLSGLVSLVGYVRWDDRHHA